MILSKQMVAALREDLKSKPLGEKEIRKVPGMGSFYVTKHRIDIDDGRADKETVINGTEYWFNYAMNIDGTEYYFYGGLRNVPAA